MKRLSRFNKVLITAAVVATSGGVSLGITSLVSADSEGSSAVVAVVGSELESEPAGPRSMHGGKKGIHSEALAELFDMTVDELREAMHSGKSLAAIAEEKNVDLSKVTELLVSEFSAHLDEKLEEFKANVDEMVTMTPHARGEIGSSGEVRPGGHHGRGGHRF